MVEEGCLGALVRVSSSSFTSSSVAETDRQRESRGNKNAFEGTHLALNVSFLTIPSKKT